MQEKKFETHGPIIRKTRVKKDARRSAKGYKGLKKYMVAHKSGIHQSVTEMSHLTMSFLLDSR
jgi:hypothetical protein